MKRVKCKSGVTGWQGRLRKNYSSFEEFEHYSEIYGISRRLGYQNAEEAWEDNPLIQGSVNPSDLQKVPIVTPSDPRWKNNVKVKKVKP